MKRVAIAILFLIAGLLVAAQSLRPVSVVNSLYGTNGLLALRPVTNQTVVVLGNNAANDASPRIATHGASWGSTNNTDIFDAIGGGQWKLVSAGGSSSPPSTNSGTVVSVGGTYGAQVNIASTAEIAAALVGTNGNLTLVDGSIGTNRLSAAAFAALINRTNHTGNIGWSVVTGTPTTRSGYGITDAQPIDADLTSLAGVTWANGDFAWYDGTKLTNFLSTSAGRSLLSAASSSAARSTLGLVIGTDVQAYDADLLNLAGVPWANGDFAWFDGAKMTNFASTATGRSILSSASASAVRTLLNLVVGTDVQAFDSDLSATAGLTGTGIISRTGSGTQATRTITGTSGRLTVSNGDGVSANPTLDIDTNSLSASINAGAPNGAGSFIHWSRLVGVPVGFADGSDDGSGGGSAVSVGGTSMATANFSQSTPSAPAGAVNVTPQSSTTNFSAYVYPTKTLLSWSAAQYIPASANAATFTTRSQGGALAPAVSFGPTTQQDTFFEGVLPSGFNPSGGVSIGLCWDSAGTTPSSNVVWRVGLTNLCGATYNASTNIVVAPSGVAFEVTNSVAQLPSLNALAAGCLVRIKVSRVTGDASDTNSFASGLRGIQLNAISQ